MVYYIYLAIVFLILAIVFYMMGSRGVAGFNRESAKWVAITFVAAAIVTYFL